MHIFNNAGKLNLQLLIRICRHFILLEAFALVLDNLLNCMVYFKQ